MRTVRLGRTDVEVSAVSLGTWAHGGPKIVNGRPVGWYGKRDELARKALREALDQGITHWDTADVYGDGQAERLIGEVLEDIPRDDVFLASKVGWSPGPYDHYYHPEQMKNQLEASLRNLKTDHVDLYYLHHCNFGPDDRYLDEAVETIRSFREAGKIRFIGLSDWKCESILRCADRVDPDVVQCYRNVVDDNYESSGLKAWCDENDIGAAFFSPLKHALLLGFFEGPVTFGHGDHRNALQDFRDLGLLARLRACRQELEKRFADREQPVLHGLLGALFTDAPNACALVGLHRPSQVREAAVAGEPLESDAARWVRELYRENGRPTRASWRSFHQES